MKAAILGKGKQRVIVTTAARAQEYVRDGWQVVAFIRHDAVFQVEAA